ncbi:MAG: hypothetical protein GDA43_17750 [Hormoscilla sp. SP5CHS1]|nr:hypothetical protein [Hormoscilla sp. SP12CHS1]MBC6454811.1 hypothetical protein [Hormoscilla sp. SP5CHS1]
MPNRFRNENLRTLGIVVDADRDVAARWQAVGNRLRSVGYQNIPSSPPAEGWVDRQAELPQVGVWLMPNNQVPGMLEDFVASLIPSEDALLAKAETVLQELEATGINRYSIVQHPKALIHTWLAW